MPQSCYRWRDDMPFFDMFSVTHDTSDNETEHARIFKSTA